MSLYSVPVYVNGTFVLIFTLYLIDILQELHTSYAVQRISAPQPGGGGGVSVPSGGIGAVSNFIGPAANRGPHGYGHNVVNPSAGGGGHGGGCHRSSVASGGQGSQLWDTLKLNRSYNHYKNMAG